MPHLAFTVSSVLAFVYLFYKERDVDVYLVAATSGILFFSAAYTGRIEGPRGYPPLEPPAVLYYSFSFYLIAILLAACVKDARHEKRANWAAPVPPTSTRIAVVAFAIWALSAIHLIASYPDHVFSGCKTTLMSAAGARHTLALSMSMLAATCILTSRVPGRFAAAAGILGFSLLVGDRTATALTIIACVLIYGQSLGPVAILRKRPLLFPIAIVALITAGTALKWGYSAYRAGGVLAVQEVMTTRSPLEIIHDGAEFWTTQYMFADIVNSNFATDGGSILRAPLSALPIPRHIYTSGSDEFNQLFQPVLYPDVTWGMAFNPFAEFYSAAGVMGILAFVIATQCALYVIDRSSRSPRYAQWLPFVALAGSLVAFYTHRNSAAVTFAMIRNVFWPYVVVLALSRLRLATIIASWVDRRHGVGRSASTWYHLKSRRARASWPCNAARADTRQGHKYPTILLNKKHLPAETQ